MIELWPERAIILQAGAFALRWYGVLYIAALGLAWLWWPRLEKYRALSLSVEQRLYLFTLLFGGAVLGGRLGYVVFWEPSFFLQHPGEIAAIWHGGMSSHGGFVGAAAAVWIAGRHLAVSPWRLLDVAIVPLAAGLALGRLGNFINQELYGTVTALPWGVGVPGAEGLRHPVQLYAAAKDVILATVGWQILRRSRTSGQATAIFLLGYGALRFWTEYYREQFWQPVGPFTRGQFLTLPIILAGGLLWGWLNVFNKKNRLGPKTP